MKKLDILIIDSDVSVRMRLKQATMSVATFGKVLQASTLEEGLSRLREAEATVDVTFISFRVDRERLNAFIEEAKSIPKSQDSAFVMIAEANQKQNAAAAKSLLDGIDGFLVEPYSIDQLVALSTLVAEVRVNRAAAREAAAVIFLVKDIMANLEAVWTLKTCSADADRAIEKLRIVCSRLPGLGDKSKEIYFQKLIDNLMLVPAPKRDGKLH